MNTPHMRVLISLAITTLLLAACSDQGKVEPAISGAPGATVSATEMRFSQAEIRLPPDGVNLTFRNDGAIEHDLTIPQLGVRLVARPGGSVTTGLRSLRAGRYEAICTVGGHKEAGMRTTVIVD